MGKYLYCIIKQNKPEKFTISGIDGKQVYGIGYGDMSVMVSDTTKRDGDYLITRDYTISHQRVLEEVMRSGYDILPVSFGTIADNDKEIKEKLLAQRRDEFDKAFKYIGGKVELNLKILWKDISAVFKDIATESKIIKKAKQISRHKSLGRFQAANVGEVVKKALEAKRTQVAEKILCKVRPFAADTREGEILQDAMICNETFLVPKALGKDYDKRVIDLARTYNGKLNFMHYGPLPPYNFVSIRVSFND